MATAPLTADDISAKIQLAQRLLKRENDRLEELMGFVTATRDNIKHLEQALLEYRAVINPSPIRRCPPEVLGVVFQFLVGDYGDLIAISLVCKQWYNLVLQDPWLWCTIRVELPNNAKWKWKTESWSRSNRSYISKCLERSGSLPLKVELDFESLMNRSDLLVKLLESGLRDTTRCTLPETDQRSIVSWLCECEGLPELAYRLKIFSDWDVDDILGLVDEFIGSDAQITSRWDSLDIQFPKSDMSDDLGEQLVGHVTNLSCLRIAASYCQRAHNFWDLPNISALEVACFCWIKLLSLNPASLQRLSIGFCNKRHGFSELARFEQLRSLTMNVAKKRSALSSPEHYSMSFPLLQELILKGHIRHIPQTNWNCPSLRRLAMCCTTDQIIDAYNASNWPHAFPLQVHWEVPVTHHDDWEVSVIWSVLELFLLLFPSAENLSVPLQAKDTLVDLLKELSNDGSLPPDWKTISFHSGNGENNETVLVERIVGT